MTDDEQTTAGEGCSLPPQPPFDIGESVYCPDKKKRRSNRLLLYEGIIRSTRWERLTFPEADEEKSPEQQKDEWSFLVHFVGWNSRWDQWLPSSDILKATEENRASMRSQERDVRQQQQQSQIQSAAIPKPSKSARSESPSSLSPTSQSHPTKRSRTTHATPSSLLQTSSSNWNKSPLEYSSFEYTNYCELPMTLKIVLLEECERITASNAMDHPHCRTRDDNNDNIQVQCTLPIRLVHNLPAKVTVRRVLKHFGKQKIKECQKAQTVQASSSSPPPLASNTTNPPLLTADTVQSIVDGLGQLFHAALPVCLLYPQERPQYQVLQTDLAASSADTHKPIDWATVYGCEFLLRLYVRLPMLLHGEATILQKQRQKSSTKSSFSGTTTTNGSSSSAAATPLDLPSALGPLLTELLVWMQKNRAVLFPRRSRKSDMHYRTPRYPDEWFDWEKYRKVKEERRLSRSST